MGREIRRVPANWQHPKVEKPNYIKGCMEERYQPMYDRSCQQAWDDWQARYAEWISGEHDQVIADYGEAEYPKNEPYRAFCEWNGRPPDPEYYRPHWDEAEMTWYQVYETVSEGTPVSPPFATQAELVEYLVANGDFWDQRRRADGVGGIDCDPWSRKAAEHFVYGAGWAPSFIAQGNGVDEGKRVVPQDTEE